MATKTIKERFKEVSAKVDRLNEKIDKLSHYYSYEELSGLYNELAAAHGEYYKLGKILGIIA